MELGDETVPESFRIDAVCPNTSIRSGTSEYRETTDFEEGIIDQLRILSQLEIITGPIDCL